MFMGIAVKDAKHLVKGITAPAIFLIQLKALHDTHLFQPRCGKVAVLTNLG
jgi:hypothetical protein